MTLLLALLGRIGLPERYRRITAMAALGLAAVIALAVLKIRYDHGVIEHHQAEVAARATEARDLAAAERVSDAARVSANQKDLDHAIDLAAPGGTLSPAAHALACERLRKLGRVPAACRPRRAD